MIKQISLTFKKYINNFSGLNRVCWEGIGLTFLNAISAGICFFLSIYFVSDLKMKISTAGLLISCYGFGTVIGGLLAGKLSDAISPPLISISSLFIQGVTFFLIATTKSTSVLTAYLFILGASLYGFKTSNNAWILRHCSKNLRLKTFGILHMASNLGLGVSGISIGLFSKYGFQNLFYTFGFVLLLSAGYLIFSIKNVSSLEIRKDETAEKTTSANKKVNAQILFLILSNVFLIGLLIAQLGSTYPIYVQNIFPELGVKAVSILFILDTILIVLFQTPLTNFLDNYNKILMVGLGAFLMGTGMLVLSFSFAFMLAIISCILWTTGEMIFISMAQLVCYENGGEKKKGQSLGMFQSTFAASNVAGPILGGIIYQNYGGNLLWYLSAIIGIFCLVTCICYGKTNQR